MTDIALTTMSTALWIVATVALFILLAGWSTGTSWGLSASLVRGVRSWADRNGVAMPVTSPGAEALRPILDPYAFVRRDGRDARGQLAGPVAPTLHADATPWVEAELIDLGERRLPR